ncbi:alpha/beta-hydrolase [Artomyces pyxidatus]|uniref:Alpha/beta-hydrolase n=1 Tax=Artomyces pyxidatus TaxID=48021 RepID=A0ACB8TB98_9AGAM|nr:alpha/beta-hydrolase [Artomyces pyxidatus]
MVRHATLKTTFTGIQHSLSTTEVPVHQYRGIKYASIPARFRQSKLFTAYHSRTDATRYGPVCPQPKGKTVEEELFGFAEDEFPVQNLKQIESECLNLNITCPGGLSRSSCLPVLLWIHGGGHRGSGSHWLYDGGALVQNSIRIGKPVILVTMNYRLGLLGFAASPKLLEDNEVAGNEGVGNYGLRDQRRAMEWVHHFISDFGGDPSNITVFGEGHGAADILCHLSSSANATHPIFQRSIIQSAIIDHNIPTVSLAGAHLSRIMSALGVHNIEELRRMSVDKLVNIGIGTRAVDDGVFFRRGWKQGPAAEDYPHHHLHIPENFSLTSHSMIERHLTEHHSSPPSKVSPKVFQLIQQQTSPHPTAGLTSAPRQPIMIGDCGYESFVYSLPASQWTASGLVRRIKAICQSVSKASALLRAYDISAHTPEDELQERVLELINDARFAWPTHCVAEAYREAGLAKASKASGKTSFGGTWRYVFDQEAPRRGIAHHAVDLLYLFDNVRPEFAPPSSLRAIPDAYPDSDDDSDSFDNSAFESCTFPSELDTPADSECAWSMPVVDEYTYNRVRDALQSRWLAFAYGEAPWSEDKVYVFGPEGETGERSQDIFEGRRRTAAWQAVLEPLGRELVQKIGLELSNGPSGCGLYVH